MMRLRNNLRAKRRFRAVPVNIEPVEPLYLFVFTYIVIGKPVPAFPAHALEHFTVKLDQFDVRDNATK